MSALFLPVSLEPLAPTQGCPCPRAFRLHLLLFLHTLAKHSKRGHRPALWMLSSHCLLMSLPGLGQGSPPPPPSSGSVLTRGPHLAMAAACIARASAFPCSQGTAVIPQGPRLSNTARGPSSRSSLASSPYIPLDAPAAASPLRQPLLCYSGGVTSPPTLCGCSHLSPVREPLPPQIPPAQILSREAPQALCPCPLPPRHTAKQPEAY